MTNLRRQGREAGFTLVEAIIVIVITGIIAGMVALFIRVPVQSNIDTRSRAELADAADLALRRMSRELRLAVPNSVAVYSNKLAIQFLLTKTGARYVNVLDGAPATLKPLDFVGGNNTFDMVGAAPTGRQAIVPGDYIVIGNLGIAPANAYDYGKGANNISRVSAVAGSRITLQANSFSTTQSPASTFQVVTGKVTYVCTPGANGAGTLQRFFNATDLSAGLGALGNGALLSDKIAGCIFDNTVLPGQNGGSLMTMVLSLQHANGERAQLVRQTQLDNPPS
ncbi:prepilin-type N-terminal cleavage/methylation domain-containing protein [Pseudoduganella umbonata]|uniref:MSHA biogenesis protein MshO n=1 Tax=Pseudoduganella umbonata TaxID=864828 RepID=A0A4P8HMY1_9BURK|nr:prepilin-type N-terminal cleavage/methylation domain-containing protein [Pseudoduganella umbonata]MBB3219661.1 MSHA biogenesis protein MshO [Pseudoduganella umbonata]QCP09720.1 prepilin-type cleavage/methylation domain-containing protein [Pseudoduganella umbonata]